MVSFSVVSSELLPRQRSVVDYAHGAPTDFRKVLPIGHGSCWPMTKQHLRSVFGSYRQFLVTA